MKKKKKKKKIIIGAAVVLVAAGGISVAAQRKSGEDQIPQVPVVTVQTGDVDRSWMLPELWEVRKRKRIILL